jgi:hypothetical protein
MFGSTILEVAIGMVFIYLLLSLIITAATELIASYMNWRADNLRKGLQRLLDPTLAQELYNHPLIKNLAKSNRGPSYIPSETFALALIDVIANLDSATVQGAKDFETLIKSVPSTDVRRVLSLLAAEAGQDGQKLQKNIENWFNNSMDRVAGWYKRKTQAVNVTLAIVLAIALNADSVLIVRSLSNDSALRAALVAQAQELAKTTPAESEKVQPGTNAAADELEKRINKLSGLGLPVGWTDDKSGDASRRWPGWMPSETDTKTWGVTWSETIRDHFLGWLLTALAVSLGAPFWFDVLNKIITIRSAGKVPEDKTKPSGKVSGVDYVIRT